MSTPERICPSCGTPAEASSRFCTVCGANLPEPVAVAAAAEAAPGEPLAAWAEREPGTPAASLRGGVPWRAVEALGVFVLSIVATAIVAVPVVIAFGDDVDASTVIIVAANGLLLLATVLLWARLVHGARPRDLGFRKVTFANVGIGVGIGVGGVLAAAAVSAFLATVIEAVTDTKVTDPEQIPLQDSTPEGWMLAVIGLGVVVIAPLAEEAFFRGFLYPAIRRWARPWPAVLLSSVIFAVTHLIPLVIPPIFVLALALAWLVEWRRSIVPAIVAHMVFNTVGFLAIFVAEPAPSDQALRALGF